MTAVAPCAPLDTPAGFVYVDTATGGVGKRNCVLRLDTYRPPAGAADCFVTVLQFPEDLVRHAQATPSPTTGKPPSVASYRGPAFAAFVPFDFDDAADP